MVADAPATSVPITAAGFNRYFVWPSLSQATVQTCGGSLALLAVRTSVLLQVRVAKRWTTSAGGVSPLVAAGDVAADGSGVAGGAALAFGETGAGVAAAAGPSAPDDDVEKGAPAAFGEPVAFGVADALGFGFADPDGVGVAEPLGAGAEGGGAGVAAACWATSRKFSCAVWS